MNSRSWDEALAGTLVGVGIVAVIIAVVVAAWCLVRLANLTARALAKNPSCLPLWAAIVAFHVCLVLAVATLEPFLGGLWLATAGLLALVARFVELYYSEVFEEPPSAKRLANDVLHEWWLQVA
jgi:hypothetical protein